MRIAHESIDPSTPAIGIFNDSFPPIIDGVTLTVENYVRYLLEKGENVKVVTPWNPQRETASCEVIRYFSVPIPDRKPYRYGYPRLDPFIWKKLRQTPFKLIHCHCPFSSGRLGVYASRKHKIPLIGTFHSKYKSDLIHSFWFYPPGVNIIMKRILNFFNACDEVWIPQAKVEETVREYGYKGKLTVVENGIDFFSTESELIRIKADARRESGLKPDTLSILFVGQHIKEKGVFLIIEALNLLKHKLDFRMNFVGEGYATSEMKSKIREYGLESKVAVNGIVKDREILSKYYAAADIFVFPSFYDNAPLVVREAASYATPSLLLENSTAAEVIRKGDNGFLSLPDPAELASVISYLDKNREMLYKVGMNARNTLVRSWEDVVEEVADRYRVIMKNYVKF